MRLDGDTFFVPTHFYNVLGTRDSALRVSMETQSSLPRLMPEDATRRTLSEPQAQSGDGSLLR